MRFPVRSLHNLASRALATVVLTVGMTGKAASAADDAPAIVLEATPAGALAFSPDGAWLAIGAVYKGALKLWRVGGDEEPRVIEDVKALYQTVAFSPDGRLLTASRVSLDPAESVVSTWEVNGFKRLMEYKLGAFWSTFTPDSKRLAIGKFNVVEFLDPRTGTRLSGFRAQDNANVGAGEFAANGKLFATLGEEEKQIKLWNPTTGVLLRTIPIDGAAEAISVSPDGRDVAYAIENKLFVVETKSGKPRWSSGAHQDAIVKVCYAPDGEELATASHDNTVRRWNAADGAEITVSEPDRGTVQAVAYAPEGQSLAVGTSGVVLLYSLKRDRPTARGQGAAQAAIALQFKTRAVDWKSGDERKPLLTIKQGNGFICGLAGNFAGEADSFDMQVGKDGVWSLSGTSTDFIGVRATAATELKPGCFSPQVARFEWSAGKAPTKMLHKKDGICLLAGIRGALRGYGEEVKIELADDGYWYLEGKSAQGGLRATALGIKWNKPGVWTCSTSTYSWTTGQDAIRVGELSEGLCVLSGVSGNMQGGGEGAEIVSEEKTWLLRGSSQQQELRFDATLIRIEKVSRNAARRR